MPLKISLKPNERIILSGAVITNGPARAQLVVENEVPLLRAREIMSLEKANSPARRIYFAIQLMYVDEKNLEAHRTSYTTLVRDFLQASPSSRELIAEITALVERGQHYQALKGARRLIDYEQELIKNVTARP